MTSANKIPIELLAPARDKTVGMAAIDSGADAVYIGAPAFGARQAAGNTVEDIQALAQYAHQFGAKVLVALNTLLRDDELPQAVQMAWDMYHAGVDGLIIQDMGLLQCDLPPIRLHASTQCNNTTPAKVKWLQEVGFQRVVLARELGIEEIKDIRQKTDIELEAFVHGALCVSYSGECYLSEALQGRSANRGACAQLCRMQYDLLDKDQHCLAKQKYALSLHDMDRSQHLRELLQAGVTSLKIEGRLKGEDYVRNVVAFYRQALDQLFSEPDSPYIQASRGIVHTDFQPDLNKTFHRGGVDYFLHGRTPQLANWDTPKSTGEYIGKVIRQNHDYIELDRVSDLHNGDGLTFGDQGFSVNRVVGNRVYPNKMPILQNGTLIYRNLDKQFLDNLLHTRTCRRLPIDILFQQKGDDYLLQIGPHEQTFHYAASPANKPEQALTNIRQQLQKLGDTIYEVRNIQITISFVPFIPNSIITQWRRDTLATPAIETSSPMQSIDLTKRVIYHPTLPADIPHDYRLNVLNRKALSFYTQCGVTDIEPAFEASHDKAASLMHCKYCILHEMNHCRKQHPLPAESEPYYLRTQSGKLLRLIFDCPHCEMRILPTND